MPLPSIIIEGRLAEDPIVSFGNDGVAVSQLRVSASKRVKNEETGQWQEDQVWYGQCTVVGRVAENVAESLRKGDEVLLWGDLRSMNYAQPDGSTTWVQEVYVTRAVGTSLRWRKTPHSRDVARAEPREVPAEG